MTDRDLAFLDQLFPESGGKAFIENWWLKEYTLQHGDVSRLPKCLQAPNGALAGIHCLENWRKGDPYDVAVVDDTDYSQYTVRDLPPMAMYRVGAPIMLPNPHRQNEELANWVSEVSNELAIADDFVTVTAWFARKSYGLGIHYDPGEVILIQLVGSKKIRIGANRFTTMPDAQFELRKPCKEGVLPLFSNGFPTQESIVKDMKEIELHPGSVLAMPRGTWHESLALDSESVALALYLHTPTVVDLVIPYLRDLLRQDSFWRTPLFGLRQGYEGNKVILETMDIIATGLKALENHVSAIHPEQVVAHSEPVSKRSRRPKQAAFELQRLPETSFSVESTNSESCQIVFYGRLNMQDTKVSRLALDRSVIGALEWISEQPARFTTQEIAAACPELHLSYVNGLVDVLLETNYLALMPFPPPR